jgi:hypothetical protein
MFIQNNKIFKTVLIKNSKRLNKNLDILFINAATLGIKAKEIALNKLISKYPVYFIVNNTREAIIEAAKNNFKITILVSMLFIF